MPTYDFRCKDCGHRFEITRPITENGTPTCLNCGRAEHVVKVFPKVGISFKGSGFYKTDSRGSGKSTADKGSSSDRGESGGGSGDKAGATTAGASGSSDSSSSASSSGSSGSSGSGSAGSSAATTAS